MQHTFFFKPVSFSHRLLGLPKVLPDMNPSACIAETTNRQKHLTDTSDLDSSNSDSSRIPSPIIEVRADYDYGPLFHPHHTVGSHWNFVASFWKKHFFLIVR